MSKTVDEIVLTVRYQHRRLFVPASFARFDQVLRKALLEQFPGACIEIENGIEDYHRVYPEDFESSDDTILVGEILHDVWESWIWVVPGD